MTERNIAIIVGSLRAGSLNRKVGKAIERLAPPSLRFAEIGIGDLPLYNQDLDGDPPGQWTAFRDAVRPADGLLFVTPEYNRSQRRAQRRQPVSHRSCSTLSVRGNEHGHSLDRAYRDLPGTVGIGRRARKASIAQDPGGRGADCAQR